MSALSARPGHHVQFYDDVAYLTEQAAAALADSLGRGGIAIARAENLVAIEQELRLRGLTIDVARATEQLRLIDADQLLAMFMHDGMPDRVRFREQVGGIVQRARAAYPRGSLHVFTEMVDVLWA